jgi:hypothetical protein
VRWYNYRLEHEPILVPSLLPVVTTPDSGLERRLVSDLNIVVQGCFYHLTQRTLNISYVKFRLVFFKVFVAH